jgi:hypothetical protein
MEKPSLGVAKLHKENYRLFVSGPEKKSIGSQQIPRNTLLAPIPSLLGMPGMVRLCVNTLISGMMKQSV